MTISLHQHSAASTKGPNRFRREASGTKPPRRPRKLLLLVGLLLVLFAALLFFGLVLYGSHLAEQQPAAKASALAGKPAPTDPDKLQKANATLTKRLAALAAKPDEPYIVVDSALNRVYWWQNGVVLREMIASCGTGNILEDPASGRKWVFETPRDERKVWMKKAAPVWMKPDWAFIEEGEEIPKDGSGRAEPGVMGDYAVAIGDGYYLHGTLYKRLLGRNVSHGCVRLGDDDIEFIYKTAKIGTRVILF
ncbi:MAG: L,D-transpeptidase [Deltaproteobacteria bacterium HGW-Deltaproteobacteria-4]|nr:MAG: L,D-transpeptidase [Deltaproteobacteria bacterium HGW-Deltaproteobacteria-4]